MSNEKLVDEAVSVAKGELNLEPEKQSLVDTYRAVYVSALDAVVSNIGAPSVGLLQLFQMRFRLLVTLIASIMKGATHDALEDPRYMSGLVWGAISETLQSGTNRVGVA